MIDLIQLGLRRAYYQNRRFQNAFEGFDNKMIEYLLTVFVAIELNNSGAFSGNAKIQLEFPLWQFYNNAFPSSKWIGENDFFAQKTFVRRQYNKPKTKERIDIVVMQEVNPNIIRSIHGIELKAINSSYTNVIEDIIRLSDSMITIDNIDDNSIKSCYSCFLKSFNRSKSVQGRTELDRIKQEFETEFESILSNQIRNRNQYTSLSYAMHVDVIDDESSESYLEKYCGAPDPPDYADAAVATGQVLGVVIEITRR